VLFDDIAQVRTLETLLIDLTRGATTESRT